MLSNFIMALRTGWWAAFHWRQLSFTHYDQLRPYRDSDGRLWYGRRGYLDTAPFAAANRAQFWKDYGSKLP